MSRGHYLLDYHAIDQAQYQEAQIRPHTYDVLSETKYRHRGAAMFACFKNLDTLLKEQRVARTHLHDVTLTWKPRGRHGRAWRYHHKHALLGKALKLPEDH